MKKIFLFLCLCFPLLVAHAAVPSRITYQGRLAKSGVGAIGRHTITVQFVDKDGTNLPASQTFDVDVPTSGDFSLDISNIPPDADWMNGLPKMRVIIGGEILTPDQAFSAAPYALVARNVENLTTDKVKLAPTTSPLGGGFLSSWQSPINPFGINASVIVGTVTTTTNHGTNHGSGGIDPIPDGSLTPRKTEGIAMVLNSPVTQTIQPTEPLAVPLIIKGKPGSDRSRNLLEVWDNADVPEKRFHIKGDGTSYFKGKFGIGTDTPLEMLDILGGNIILGSPSDLGGNNFGALKFRSSSGTISLRSSTSGLFGTAGSRRGLALDLQNDDTSTFEIVRDIVGPVFGVRASGQVYVGGNIGVGTATPLGKLNVVSNTIYNNVTGGLSITSDSTSSYDTGIGLGADAINHIGYIQSASYAGYTNRPLIINPNGGKVGIGELTPTNTLTIGANSDRTNVNTRFNGKTTSVGGDPRDTYPAGYLYININGTERKIPYY